MARRMFAAAVFLCGLALAGLDALAKGPEIEIPFKAKAGDTFKVRVTVMERESENGAVQKEQIRSSNYDGRIETITKDGYRISWTSRGGESKIVADKKGTLAAQQQSLKAINKAFSGQATTVETLADGTPIRISDWAATSQKLAGLLRTALTEVMEKAVADQKTDAPAEKIKEFVNGQVNAIIQNLILRHDERSAVVLLEEMGMLASIQHRKLAVGEPFVEEQRAPATFGDGTVGRKDSITLTKLDRQKDEAFFTWKSEFDGNQMREFILPIVRQQFEAGLALQPEDKREEARKNFEAELGGLTINRTDTGTGVVRISTGWAKRVEQNSRTETSGSGGGQVSEKRRTVEVFSKAR